MNTPLHAYRRHFELVFAAYELSQLVVPDMEAAGYGAIINVTSGASRMPGDGPYPDRSYGVLAGYGGSKAALEHLTQCSAYEVADRNIAVNSLSPSKAILTPGVAYYSKVFEDMAPEEDFAEAAVRLSIVDPNVVTGKIIGHADVLDGSFRPYVYRGAGVR
jgi:NAD(P)-dependent dehydrogenase (short-subunit alcohol dehydrogenase family)